MHKPQFHVDRADLARRIRAARVPIPAEDDCFYAANTPALFARLDGGRPNLTFLTSTVELVLLSI